MSIEYNPAGVTCNLACPYCYEHPQRDAGNFTKEYDAEAVKKALEEEGGSFTMFGGEPLLASKEHLEEMWAWGYEKYGYNGMQSNGVLIDDDHMKMFEKYNVHVGFSMDGPDELNDSRWKTNIEDTREASKKSEENLYRILKHPNISCSLILTLYQGNVRNGRFKKLKRWLRKLDKLGLQSARIHLLEVDHEEVEKKMKLTDEENVECMIELHELEQTFSNLTFDVFKDIKRLLTGDDDNVTCVFNACDPYTTRAVRGVDANGDRHNCGRTNKDGVNWFKSDVSGKERQLALYHTPWEDKGCKGCRFFVMCKGECPGTGEEADWRNKTDQCWVWYRLFEHVEQFLLDQGCEPVSLKTNLKDIETIMLQHWARGQHINIKRALEILGSRQQGQRVSSSVNISHSDDHGDYSDHGDHTDNPNGKKQSGHADKNVSIPHGDKAHGDHSDARPHGDSSHGDHGDDSPQHHGDHGDNKN